MAKGGILKNAFTVGAFTALSRVLGLVREMLQSRLIGAGVQQSAFTLAFALPNMARKMFGEGALTAAFVPVFKGELEKTSVEHAAKLARSVMTMVLMILAAVAAVSTGALEALSRHAGTFGIEDGERFRITVWLVRTLVPYMVFICAAAFGMGVLNALGRFKASSFMPCLLNICWIGVLAWMWFSPGLDPTRRIQRVAVAILCAGALQMAFMFWMMARSGVKPYLSFSGWRDAKVVKVWRNVAIGAMGAGAVQINYMLDQLLAQLAAPWAAGVVGYAERLMDLPLGVIGVAFGTVLLPTFSGRFSKGDGEGAKSDFVKSLDSMLFVMIPAGFGLAVLAGETTAAIYQGGEFDAMATTRVSRAIAVYAAGLAFFGIQKILVPWFQAQGDMKTPLKVSVRMVFLNAALNIAAVAGLPVEWRHVGLAASTVFCAIAGSAMLYVAARRVNGPLGIALVAPSAAKSAAASAVMSAAIAALKPSAAACAAWAGPVVSRYVSLGILVAAGLAVYLVAMKAMSPSRRLLPLKARRSRQDGTRR